MIATMSDLVWLKSLLASLGVFLLEPMKLNYDSEAIIQIAKNPNFHEWTKHIEIDCRFVGENIHSGDLDVIYVSNRQQPANIFIKALRLH